LVTREDAPTALDQRMARLVGWVLVVSSIGFALALIFIPLGAGLVAQVTWPEERVDACLADKACVISTLPANALPVWVAFVWIAIIALALAICWKPSRWWLPDADARRHVKVRTFTSPDWLRIHALVAAFVSLICVWGVIKRETDVFAFEYLWAVAAALVVAAAATWCMRVNAMAVPDDVRRSLLLTVSSPYGIFDKRWKALQRDLHPRTRTKQGRK
jgi:hypothetical protein